MAFLAKVPFCHGFTGFTENQLLIAANKDDEDSDSAAIAAVGIVCGAIVGLAVNTGLKDDNGDVVVTTGTGAGFTASKGFVTDSFLQRRLNKHRFFSLQLKAALAQNLPKVSPIIPAFLPPLSIWL